LLRFLPQPIRNSGRRAPDYPIRNIQRCTHTHHPLSPQRKRKYCTGRRAPLKRNFVVSYCTGRHDPARDQRRNRLHWPAGIRKDSLRRNH
ncbi:hypothetical protein NPIL_639981, partial [Nephila pilipes]